MKKSKVTQEDDYGCAVAGLAMALDMTYQEARREVQWYWENFYPFHVYSGLDAADEKIILFKHGVKTYDVRPLKPMKRSQMMHLCALLTVPSINVPGKFHSLYWDGRRIHDPSPLKRYNTPRALKAVKHIRFLMPLGKPTHKLYGINGEEDK